LSFAERSKFYRCQNDKHGNNRTCKRYSQRQPQTPSCTRQANRPAPCPRIAEQNIATSAMNPPTKKLKFIAWTKTVGFVGVAAAVPSYPQPSRRTATASR